MGKRIVCLMLLLAVLLAGCAGETVQEEADPVCRLALIPIDAEDPHWAALETGARRAAVELGVGLHVFAPEERSDEQQIAKVRQAMEAGCQAILLAANSPDALSGVLTEAREAGIKLIYVDTPAQIPAEATFCTDNHAAGRTAGETLLWELGNRGITSGNIGILNVNQTTESSMAREAGFREAFAGTAFTLLESQYSGGDPEVSQTLAEELLDQELVGLFGGNGGCLLGIGRAVQNRESRPVCVGFDRSEEIVVQIRQGYLLASMVQNPEVMGYEGVRAAVAAFNGEQLNGSVTDTGVSVLTAATAEEAAAEEQEPAFRVSLITMDSEDQHWLELKAGAEKAAQELDVELNFLAPEKKDEKAQLALVNQAVAGGCDALLLAANSGEILSEALLEAVDSGVKLIYVDSPAQIPAEATFCTDNYSAGRTAGQTMLSELRRRGIYEGSIGIINVNTTTASSMAREAGFRDAFQNTDYVLLETHYGEGDPLYSQTLARNYLSQNVVGIFACNEGATLGLGNAMKAAGTNTLCVGFDRTEAIIQLLEEGYLYATMTQNPHSMGYEGLRAAVAVLHGEHLKGVVVDTGVSVLVGR